MTSLTHEQAYDSILGLVDGVWSPLGHPIKYPNIVPAAQIPPTTATPWARAYVQHGPAGQASLSGAQGTSRFERLGVLTVQVFTPAGEGLSQSHQLGKVLVDAVDGKRTTEGVLFRRARYNEVGEDGDWYQCNFLADFEYDEVK